jgi:hypothetical protein
VLKDGMVIVQQSNDKHSYWRSFMGALRCAVAVLQFRSICFQLLTMHKLWGVHPLQAIFTPFSFGLMRD